MVFPEFSTVHNEKQWKLMINVFININKQTNKKMPSDQQRLRKISARYKEEEKQAQQFIIDVN